MIRSALHSAGQNPKAVIFTSAGVIAGVWITVFVIGRRRADRDRKAIAFFSELQRDLAPGTVGLIESDAFKIRYWEEVSKKLGKPMYMLTVASAKAFAKDIRDSWGLLDDDEDKIYGVFRALKDHVQVSQVAYQYYNDPKGDKINLIDDLNSRLSKEELGKALEIVKRMPPYRLVEPPKKK